MPLAGCSGEQAPQREQVAPGTASASTSPQAKSYPPGAAKVLSVAGATAVTGSGPYQKAVNCTAAIQSMRQLVSDLAIDLGEAEMGGVNQAATIYRQRANAAGAREGVSERDTSVAIERQVQEATDDPAPQVQLAAACLRNLAAGAD